jgi:hypothetical protein
METKFGWENLRKALLMLLGVLFWAIPQAVGLTSNAPTFGTWKVIGTPLAVIFILAGILWHFMDLQSALADRKPNIDLAENPFEVGDISMIMDIKELYNTFRVIGTSYLGQVVFSNNPKNRNDKNNADSVLAEITYLDENKNRLFPQIQGQWSIEGHININSSEKPVESIDFPNNGAKRKLALLIKYPEDEYCYGYNNDSYSHLYFQNPRFEIRCKRFFISVQLKGAFLSANRAWEFEVETKGKGDTFSIGRNGKWAKREKSSAKKVISNEKLGMSTI